MISLTSNFVLVQLVIDCLTALITTSCFMFLQVTCVKSLVLKQKPHMTVCLRPDCASEPHAFSFLHDDLYVLQ